MTFDIFKDAVEVRIKDWFATEKKSAPTVEASVLLERMYALIKRGGKRARPQLLYMTYAAYGGKSSADLVDLGLALEFHHQFLLIHDDIIDNDTIRYGGPNIVGFYLNDHLRESQNIPQAMGLLAGDLLFAFANLSVLKSHGFTEKQKIRLLEMLNDKSVGVAYGQQLDSYNVDSDLSSFTESKLLLIHSLKCSLYSTQLPMQYAAILLDLNMDERNRIDKFAEVFGLLFQLVDDYSDYFINKSVFNDRPKHRDFRQGKITHPLYIALTTASPKEVVFLKEHLGRKDLPQNTMEKVVGVLTECGAQKTSSEYLEAYFTQANEALDKLTISLKSKQEFKKMIEKYRV